MKEIDVFYKDLAKEISERKLFNILEIEILLKTRFSILVSSILNNNKNQLELKRIELTEKFNVVKGQEKIRLQVELSKINSQIKLYNNSLSAEEHKTKYDLLKKFIRKKIGDELLNEFFKTIN